MSARWGGAITPYMVAVILGYLSWRSVFGLFGVIGVVWAIFFYWWYRDNPRDHKSVNQAEASLLCEEGKINYADRDVPWKRIFTSRAMWLLSIQYFCLAYSWSIYITWLPTYLQQGRGVELKENGLLAGLPLFMGGLGSLLCGFISSRLTRWVGSVAKTRRLMAYLGFCGSAGFLLLSTYVKDPVWAMIAMGFAGFATDLVMPGSWGACMDIGGKYAGTISGTMNTMSSFAAGIAPIANGYMLQSTDQRWDVIFYVASVVYLIGIFCWMFLDPVTPLEQSGPRAAVRSLSGASKAAT